MKRFESDLKQRKQFRQKQKTNFQTKHVPDCTMFFPNKTGVLQINKT